MLLDVNSGLIMRKSLMRHLVYTEKVELAYFDLWNRPVTTEIMKFPLQDGG